MNHFLKFWNLIFGKFENLEIEHVEILNPEVGILKLEIRKRGHLEIWKSVNLNIGTLQIGNFENLKIGKCDCSFAKLRVPHFYQIV